MKKSNIKCDKCEGTGYQKDEYKVVVTGPSGQEWVQGYSRTCLKCHGKGGLDWIEAVVGKKIEDLNHDELLEFSRLR
jgi:hypothetical protein